jgi:transposase-like protein
MSKSTISTFQLFERFPDKESARLYFESRLWPVGPVCPVCKGQERITVRKGGYYRCNACSEDFTVRTGTVMERSHVSLDKWLACMAVLMERPRLSSPQLAEAVGLSQPTAWGVRERLLEAAEDALMEAGDFRLVSGWSFYRVSPDGSMWTRHGKRKRWHQLRPTVDGYGYRSVQLCDRRGPVKRLKRIRVCRIVCAAFHGPCPSGQECRHLDGQQTNDRADNLTWGTKQEQAADQKRHGTMRYGLRHPNGKLSDAAVLSIRALRGTTTRTAAAKQFGVSRRWVAQIWEGTARTHLTERSA